MQKAPKTSFFHTFIKVWICPDPPSVEKIYTFYFYFFFFWRLPLDTVCMCIDICTLCSRLLWCFTKHLRAQPHQIRSWNYDMISDPEFITKIFKGEEFSWKEVLVLNFLSNKDENFHLFTKFHCLIFLKKVSRPFSY